MLDFEVNTVAGRVIVHIVDDMGVDICETINFHQWAQFKQQVDYAICQMDGGIPGCGIVKRKPKK